MTKDVLRSDVRALELQIIKLIELYVSLRAQAFGFELKNRTIRDQSGEIDIASLFSEGQDHLVFIVNMRVSCIYCMSYADGFMGVPNHLGDDAALVLCSGSPPEEINAHKEKRGWPFDCYSFVSNDLPKELGLYSDDEGIMPGAVGFTRQGDKITVASVNDFGCGDIFAPAWHLRALIDPKWMELEPKTL